MPAIASTTAPTTSPSSATWLSISFARSRQRAPCASRSSGRDGRTHSSPKSSLKFEMRLPCRQPAKGADRPEPKGHGIVDWNPRRRWRQDPIGRSRPIRLSTLDNRVSPTRPVAARRRYSDRKEGDGGGGRGCRRKRKPSCNGADRAARAGIPNPKGRRLPVSGTMRLDASTDGDVRRRKLNKDGCRKPLVRRNQDRVLHGLRHDRNPTKLGLMDCVGLE